MVLNLKGLTVPQRTFCLPGVFTNEFNGEKQEKLDGHNYARQDIFANLASGCVELRQ